MQSQTKRRMQTDFFGKRRHGHVQGKINTLQVTYKRFRRLIIRQSLRGGPAASTPVPSPAPGWQCEPSFEFDSVCQRLELDSPPRLHEEHQEKALRVAVGDHQEPLKPMSPVFLRNETTEQRWVWKTAAGTWQSNKAVDKVRSWDSQPFVALNKTVQERLSAPSLLNDYYTNLLDCSCNGMVALALGSSVYLWNSKSCTLEGHLDAGLQHHHMHSITCLCWSRDGTALCIGTRQGEVQLWDVEYQQKMRHIPSHWSVVGALCCKQQLYSSGSVLGHIHHVDPRASQPLVGAAVQKEGICSLQWSPGENWLASGSTDGSLHIWDDNVTGEKQNPLSSMKQPSAVKAMGWCPWEHKMIVTGGGWQDGKLRVWETQSGCCVSSVNTNSQFCSLRWVEKKRLMITGHGSPHHQVTCWNWDGHSLSSVHRLNGHSQRVLHLAVNPNKDQIYSAGADQCFHIWDL